MSATTPPLDRRDETAGDAPRVERWITISLVGLGLLIGALALPPSVRAVVLVAGAAIVALGLGMLVVQELRSRR